MRRAAIAVAVAALAIGLIVPAAAGAAPGRNAKARAADLLEELAARLRREDAEG